MRQILNSVAGYAAATGKNILMMFLCVFVIGTMSMGLSSCGTEVDTIV